MQLRRSYNRRMFGFKKHRIYLDYASAPPVLPAAEKAVLEASHFIGNPGAIHSEGVAAKAALEDARTRIAALIGCKSKEIIFTSGLTEANNLSILGFARKLAFAKTNFSGTHWIVSSIEHASVLDAFAEIERLGGRVTHIDPDEKGIIRPETVTLALRPETVFLSVGWANNELGVVQPLADIASTLREHEEKYRGTVLFHSDAGQAPLYLPTLVNSLGVDLLSIGANKLYGPHGIGTLFVSKRAELAGITLGGKQERRLRAGTENVALACGFAAAYEVIAHERKAESERLAGLRDELSTQLLDTIPGVVINGDTRHSLPHMLNISIPNVSSEYVTLSLDHEGIAISTKSACREGEESRSHAVEALGGEVWRAENTFRFSLGRDTRAADIRRTVRAIAAILARHAKS